MLTLLKVCWVALITEKPHFLSVAVVFQTPESLLCEWLEVVWWFGCYLATPTLPLSQATLVFLRLTSQLGIAIRILLWCVGFLGWSSLASGSQLVLSAQVEDSWVAPLWLVHFEVCFRCLEVDLTTFQVLVLGHFAPTQVLRCVSDQCACAKRSKVSFPTYAWFLTAQGILQVDVVHLHDWFMPGVLWEIFEALCFASSEIQVLSFERGFFTVWKIQAMQSNFAILDLNKLTAQLTAQATL